MYYLFHAHGNSKSSSLYDPSDTRGDNRHGDKHAIVVVPLEIDEMSGSGAVVLRFR